MNAVESGSGRRLWRLAPKATVICSWVLAAGVIGCDAPSDPFEDPPTACPAPAQQDAPGRASAVVPGPEVMGKGVQVSATATGHSLAQSGQRLLVLDEANGTLVVLDSASLAVTATYPVGARPWRLVATATQAWVTLRGSDAVAQVDLETGKIALFVVGTEPTGIALGAQLFVAVAGTQQLVVLQPQTGALLAKADVLARPQAVAVDSGGIITVAHQSAGILHFSLSPTLQLSQVDQVQLAPSASLLGKTGSAPGGPHHATRAVAVAVDPGTGKPVVAHVVVRSGTIDDALAASTAPEKDCNAVTSAGSSLDGDMQSGDLGGGGYGGSSSGPQNLGGGVRPVEPALTPVPLAASTKEPLASSWHAPAGSDASELAYLGRRVVARLDQPSDLAFHPQVRMALVAGRGTDNLIAIDTLRESALGLVQLPHGSAPGGVIIAATGDVAWVQLSHASQVAEIPLGALTADQVAGARVVQPSRLSPVYGADPLPAAARLGRQVFFGAENPRLARFGHFACATCHLDGDEDQQVWFVADGPRQTPVLAGRLHNTGPFNWKGTQSVLKFNMKDTVRRMHGTGLSGAELESLEQFLLVGLTPAPNPYRQPQGLTEAQQRGKLIFDSPKAGCSFCHTAGAGTDGQLHDVGIATKGELDLLAARGQGKEALRYNTPSLVGVYRSAPYFHNGAAATLMEVLNTTSDVGMMGDTSDLTDDQRQDLIAYLQTL